MFNILKKIQRGISVFFPTRKSIGGAGSNSHIEFPVFVSTPKNLFMAPDTRLRQGSKLLNSLADKIIIKRFSVVSMNCMIVTNNHKSTVGIPQILLGVSLINDKGRSLTIEEDVWIGANVTILCIEKIGRGAVVGACCTVTKDVPPYAIVVGSPAKIVGVKFSIDQIIEHEKILYPEQERFSRDYLESLFAEYYVDKRIFGVKTEFTKDHVERLEVCMKRRKFTDTSYLDRVKSISNMDASCTPEEREVFHADL